MNQCDGCARDLPVRKGIHYDPRTDLPVQGCTRDLYGGDPRLCMMYDLYMVTVYKDGCVFETEFQESIWVPLGQSVPYMVGSILFTSTIKGSERRSDYVQDPMDFVLKRYAEAKLVPPI